MNILILEDNPERIEFFNRWLNAFGDIFGENELFITDQVEEAKELYSKHTFNHIFLDHDLDGLVYVDSKENNTGYQFALFLAQQPGIKDTYITIHTMNPVGAQNMKSVLPWADYMPFNYLKDLVFYKE